MKLHDKLVQCLPVLLLLVLTAVVDLGMYLIIDNILTSFDCFPLCDETNSKPSEIICNAYMYLLTLHTQV